MEEHSNYRKKSGRLGNQVAVLAQMEEHSNYNGDDGSLDPKVSQSSLKWKSTLTKQDLDDAHAIRRSPRSNGRAL